MFSRVLGLVRDIALVLIPLGSREAFFVAFRFPNMLRELIGEGATNAAFIPVLAETSANDSEDEYQRLVRATFGAMIALLAIITVFGMAAVPFIVRGGLGVLGPVAGAAPRDPGYVELMAALSVWTFPYIFFIGLCAFMMAPLFTMKHYTTPSWTPALLNVALIAAVFLFRDLFVDPAYALVFGVWLGGVAQLAAQYIALGNVTGVWLPSFDLGHPGLRKMLWLLGPVLIGQSASEVNKLVDTLFAAALPAGAVNALQYGNRLVQLPLSIFGVATAVAILPHLSRAAAQNRTDQIRLTLMDGLRRSFFLVFPATLGLIAFAEPIVRLLFQYGAWTALDTEQTTSALRYYALGLLAFAWVKVAVSGFYAVQNTRTPVVIAASAMLLNILLNFVLVQPFGFRGLALATSIAFTINFLLLYGFLSHRFGLLAAPDFLGGLGRMTAAAAAATAVAYASYFALGRSFTDDTIAARVAMALVPIAVAVAAYAALSHTLGVSELNDFLRVLRRRRS